MVADAHLKAIGRTLRLVSLLCLPTLGGLALMADILILERWQGSVRPFQVLSIFGIFFALSLICSQILLSAGFVGPFVHLSFINVVMFLTAVTLAARHGLVEAALSGGIANMIAVPIYAPALRRRLGLNLLDCLMDQWPVWAAIGMMTRPLFLSGLIWQADWSTRSRVSRHAWSSAVVRFYL